MNGRGLKRGGCNRRGRGNNLHLHLVDDFNTNQNDRGNDNETFFRNNGGNNDFGNYNPEEEEECHWRFCNPPRENETQRNETFFRNNETFFRNNGERFFRDNVPPFRMNAVLHPRRENNNRDNIDGPIIPPRINGRFNACFKRMTLCDSIPGLPKHEHDDYAPINLPCEYFASSHNASSFERRCRRGDLGANNVVSSSSEETSEDSNSDYVVELNGNLSRNNQIIACLRPGRMSLVRSSPVIQNRSRVHNEIDDVIARTRMMFPESNSNFEEYMNIKSVKADSYFRVVKEKEVDLWEMPDDYSLGHCIPQDLNIKSGLASQFQLKFNHMPELLVQSIKKGDVAFVSDKDRFIYYLVTNKDSSERPNLRTLFTTLLRLKELMMINEVTKLAIPRIACDSDGGLEWSDVKFMLEYIFRNIKVEIIVCNECVEVLNDKELCVICYERSKTHAIIPCGHFILCAQCAQALTDRAMRVCPVCRSSWFCITHIIM